MGSGSQSQSRNTGGGSGNPEIPHELPEKLAEDRAAITRGAQRERADIALDTLAGKQNPDAALISTINSLSVLEPLERQRGKIETLRRVSIPMLAAALYKKPDLDKHIDNFDNIALVGQALDQKDQTGMAAFRKLREIRDNVKSDLYAEIRKIWPTIVLEARRQKQAAKAAIEGKDSKLEKFLGTKTGKVVAVVALVAGAYAIYRIFFKRKDSDEEEAKDKDKDKKESKSEKKGGFFKWIAGIGAAILGFFTLGKILGSEKVKKFIKDKTGWNIDTSRVAQAIILASQGKLKEAWEVLWEGVDENADVHARLAQLISRDMSPKTVSGKTLFGLKDANFENFIKATTNWTDKLSQTISEYGGPLASLVGFDSAQTKEEQMTLRAFFRKHERIIRREISIKHNVTTVEDVLLGLEKYFQRLSQGAPSAAPGTQQPNAAPGAAAIAGGAAVAGGAVAATSRGDGRGGQGQSPSPDIPAAPQAPELPDERVAYTERKDLIDSLNPEAKRKRAIENEKLLTRKIDFAQIQEALTAIEDTDGKLEELVGKASKPEDKKLAEEKLRTFRQQRVELGTLLDNHTLKYSVYIDALRQNADEKTITQRFADLIEAKEQIEEHLADMFKPEGWTVLNTLAATHSLRFANFAVNRWVRTGNLNIEIANYLFDKYLDRLRPSNIRASLARLRSRVPTGTIDDITAETDRIFKAMTDYEADFHRQTQGGSGRHIDRHDFRKLDNFERQIRDQHRQLEKLWSGKTRELAAAVKASDTARADLLTKEIERIGREKARLELGAVKTAVGWWQAIKSAMRGSRGVTDASGNLTEFQEGINRLRHMFREAIKKRAAQMPGVSKILMRRGKLVFLSGAIGGIAGLALRDERTTRSQAITQGALGALPVVGTYLDFHSAFAGREKITGRKLGTKDRVVSGLFGVAGLACDALTVFGIGVAGRAALIGARTARGVGMAGRTLKAIEEAKTAASMAKTYRGYRVAETATKWGFRVSLGMMLGVPAYMIYSEFASLDVPEGFKQDVLQGLYTETEEPEVPAEGQQRQAA